MNPILNYRFFKPSFWICVRRTQHFLPGLVTFIKKAHRWGGVLFASLWKSGIMPGRSRRRRSLLRHCLQAANENRRAYCEWQQFVRWSLPHKNDPLPRFGKHRRCIPSVGADPLRGQGEACLPDCSDCRCPKSRVRCSSFPRGYESQRNRNHLGADPWYLLISKHDLSFDKIWFAHTDWGQSLHLW